MAITGQAPDVAGHVRHDRPRWRYDHKMPKLWSLLRWEQRAPGRVPDSGETYEEFIQCQLPLQQWSEGKTSGQTPVT